MSPSATKRVNVAEVASTAAEVGSGADYRASYDRLAATDLVSPLQPAWYLQNQAEKLVGYLPDLGGLRVCEVGVGRGELFARLAARRPLQLVGVDISRPYLLGLRADTRFSEAHLLQADAERMPFREAFDLIVATDVLEHVVSASDFLVGVNWALKPGGLLVLRVPHEDNMRQHARLLGARFRYGHIRRFTARGLQEFVGQFGFRAERLRFDGYTLDRRRWFTDLPLVRQVFPRVVRKLFPRVSDESRLPTALGRVFMRPAEMVLLARRTARVEGMALP